MKIAGARIIGRAALRIFDNKIAIPLDRYVRRLRRCLERALLKWTYDLFQARTVADFYLPVACGQEISETSLRRFETDRIHIGDVVAGSRDHIAESAEG